MDYGGTWTIKDYNFDNAIQSILTLFAMATSEGWVEVMWSGVDSSGINKEPILENNMVWVFFFIAFMVIGSLFVLNLFVGVVINTFDNEKELLSKNHLLTDTQREWIHTQIKSVSYRPLKKILVGRSDFQNKVIHFCEHQTFEIAILVCIILNTMILGLKWYGNPQEMETILEYINLAFAAIFTFEAIVKIFGYGKYYFDDGWNKFDFFIVCGTFLGIGVSAFSSISVGPSTTVIRAFRIGRVFRLV